MTAKKTAATPAKKAPAKKTAAGTAKKAAAAPKPAADGRAVCQEPGCEKLAVMRGDVFAYGGDCSKHYNEKRAARKAAKASAKEGD